MNVYVYGMHKSSCTSTCTSVLPLQAADRAVLSLKASVVYVLRELFSAFQESLATIYSYSTRGEILESNW